MTVHQSRKPSSLPIDAATLAASIQIQKDRHEIQCSCLALTAKIGLIFLGCVSLLRLSLAYQERLEHYSEISAIVSVEKVKFQSIQSRFDKLFSIGGEQRWLGEQDQWIEPNRLRIVWR